MFKVIFNKFIMPVVVPIIFIIYFFGFGFVPGILSLLIYLAGLFYMNREAFYSVFGSVNYSKKNFDKALIYFEKVAAMKSPTPQRLISYAYLLLKTANVDKSKEVFNRIYSMSLSVDNKNRADSIMALMYWKEGDVDKAISSLEKTIETFETTSIYGSLGYMYIVKGDLDKALDFNLRSFDYNSSDPVILDNLAQTYLMLNDLDKAGRTFKKLVSVKPQFPEAYYNYAEYLIKKKLYDEALENLDIATGFDTNYLSAISKDDIIKLTEEIKSLKKQEHENA